MQHSSIWSDCELVEVTRVELNLRLSADMYPRAVGDSAIDSNTRPTASGKLDRTIVMHTQLCCSDQALALVQKLTIE